MGKFILLAIITTALVSPLNVDASSKISVDMKYDGSEMSGKMRVNGERVKLDSTNNISVKDDSSNEGASNKIDIKTKGENTKTTVETNSNLDLNIKHDAGPNPDPDSTIKVTVDDEDIYTITDIGPEEEVDITYSRSLDEEEVIEEDIPADVEEEKMNEVTVDESNPIEQPIKPTLFDNIKGFLDNIASFLQNLFS